MGELKPTDIAWLRDQKEGGHCGEGTFERQGRARHNDMVDRLLAAVEARTEGRGDEPVASDKALFDALWELVAAMANEGIPKTPRTKAAFKVAHQAALDRLRKDWSSPIREPEISRTILGDPCTLEACPPGLFIADAYNTLGMKSEYRTEQGAIEAYIVESGEFFWGDNPQTVERQRAQIVRPISYADAILNLAPVAKGASQDAELSDEFDRPGRLSDATRHSAEGTADPALSGARGVGEGWRPIETAEPKNSERLMVATADTPPVVGEAWWREDYDGKLDLWWAGEGPGDYHADPIRDRNQRVTHWQPLPPPPQEQGGMK